MRHRKHNHLLGVKKEHREALIANLAAALMRHGKIRTTLAKAKALRPFVERIVTLAKKAAATDDAAQSLHYRRLAIARVRDKDAVKVLFDERAQEFKARNGGYTRIYKLIPRLGDAADMAIIELVNAADEGYGKGGRRKQPKAAKVAAAVTAGDSAAVSDAVAVTETEDGAATKSVEPKAEKPAVEPAEEKPAT